MPPSRKDLFKPKSKAKGKAKPQDPQSENDFLEAADEHEQSAGKWRAGDTAKATRFFNRAIDVYNAGLQRYPKSFDLAYNKANLEYTLSEDPRIVSILGNKISLLEETLQSHRTAVLIDPCNTDVLFNIGQVLSSLSEALLETNSQETAKPPARAYLEEALDIFTKCLNSQQSEYEQTQAEIAEANASQLQEFQAAFAAELGTRTETQGQDSMEASSPTSETPRDWATVVEPLTPETILETCTAQLAALTTLLGLYDPADLASIEMRAQDGLETANTKIPALIKLIHSSPLSKSADEPAPGPTLSIASAVAEEPETSIENDALLAVANFQSTIAEIAYRNGRSDAHQYAAQIEQIFAPLIQPPSDTTTFDLGYINALSLYADAQIELSSAIADRSLYTPTSPTFLSDLEFQWSALTLAQTLLTQLSSKSNVSTLSASRMADIFAARGDVDLFRFRIALFAEAKSAWVKSKSVLVANAGVFYRGARSYAEKAGKGDIQATADAKAVVAEVLKGAASGVEVKGEWKDKGQNVKRVLEQMVEEGIVGREEAEGVLRYIS